MIQNRLAEDRAAAENAKRMAEFYALGDEIAEKLEEQRKEQPVTSKPVAVPPPIDMLDIRAYDAPIAVPEPQPAFNYTFAFDASTGNVEVESESVPVIPEPLIKEPVVEDDIAADDVEASKWQIIDQLPVVETTTEPTAPATANDFFNVIKERHRQRLEQHMNDINDTK